MSGLELTLVGVAIALVVVFGYMLVIHLVRKRTDKKEPKPLLGVTENVETIKHSTIFRGYTEK